MAVGQSYPAILIVSIDWEYKKSLSFVHFASFRHDHPRQRRKAATGELLLTPLNTWGGRWPPSPRHVAGPVGPCSKGVATTGRAGEPGQIGGKEPGKEELDATQNQTVEIKNKMALESRHIIKRSFNWYYWSQNSGRREVGLDFKLAKSSSFDQQTCGTINTFDVRIWHW